MTSQEMQSRILLQTDFPELTLHARGKVRDLYSLNGQLLFVATDRISAFDYVLATGIPEKGRVLTQLSLFWFDFLKPVVNNHLVTARVEDYPAPLRKYADDLRGRSMLVTKAQMIDIECVARGYLSGSGWKEYQQSGAVCGIKLPTGLKESDRLPEPIFTPATKATTGHDENIGMSEVRRIAGTDDAEALRRASINIYLRAADRCRQHGLILADTKFEFGVHNGALTLVDEVLTPDSSRYWDAAAWEPGRTLPTS